MRTGRVAASKPLLCASLPALCAAALSFGLLALNIDSDPDTIWVPPTSPLSLQRTYFDAAYDPFFRISQVIISPE
jgi:Niemann-Pick C1 protein